jgi:SOS response regulatory protein OraA/RecX
MKRRQAPSRLGPRAALDAKAARLAAGDLLSRRAWTGQELQARLRRRGAPPEIAADVVADMVRRGYVDDAAFARGWVTTRAARGYGAARLRAELRARGVATAHIDAALAMFDDDVSLEKARALARRRLAILRRAPPGRGAQPRGRRAGMPARRVAGHGGTAPHVARLRDYLLRRGLAQAVVIRVVREVTGEADIVDE